LEKCVKAYGSEWSIDPTKGLAQTGRVFLQLGGDRSKKGPQKKELLRMNQGNLKLIAL
jgi:hypothetical protein